MPYGVAVKMRVESWLENVTQYRRKWPLETAIKPNSAANWCQAVVFDIYGTLLISGSGDVGSADTGGRDSLVRPVWKNLVCLNGWTPPLKQQTCNVVFRGSTRIG